MKSIEPKVEFLTPLTNDLLKAIEVAGRTCYKSEDKITEGSAEQFVRGLIARGHEAMVEHASVTMRITCDRGVTHEIVRHRVASYAQESTRYCNYSKDRFGGITYIHLDGCRPLEKKEYTDEVWAQILQEWEAACIDAEWHYLNMISFGASPQIARSVLNNSTKTEIIVTMNLRELRHMLKLRTDSAAHPQMREVMNMVLEEVRNKLPCVVADITD